MHNDSDRDKSKLPVTDMSNLPRIPEILTAYVHFDQRTEKCNARDFSEFNIFLQTATEVPLNSEIAFEIEISDQSIFLNGKVTDIVNEPRSDRREGLDVHLLQPPQSYCDLVAKFRGNDKPIEFRRGSKRYGTINKVCFESNNTFLTHYTQNLSQGGLYISTKKTLPPGSILNLKLSIPGRSEPLELKGKISYQLDEHKAKLYSKKAGVGVQFIELSSQAKEALSHYLKRVEVFRRKIRQMDEPDLPLEGQLTSFLVPELILNLASQHFTGVLDVHRKSSTRKIYFKAGKPIYAQSSNQEHSLGKHLVNEGILTPSDLAMSLTEHARDDLEYSHLLLKGKMIDSTTLAEAMIDCQEQRINSSFTWFSGEYKITPILMLPKDITIFPLRLYHLVVSGIRKWYDQPLIQAWLGIQTTHRVCRFGMPPSSAHLPWEVWQCLYQASTPIALTALCKHLDLDTEKIFPIVFALILAGWIRVIAPVEKPAPQPVKS